MEEAPEVPTKIVQGIIQAMSEPIRVKPMTVEETVKTTQELISALKEGRIPGNSIVEWMDEKGKLQVNVIDFLLNEKLKAVDPNTNEKVLVNTASIPDGVWRLLI